MQQGPQAPAETRPQGRHPAEADIREAFAVGPLGCGLCIGSDPWVAADPSCSASIMARAMMIWVPMPAVLATAGASTCYRLNREWIWGRPLSTCHASPCGAGAGCVRGFRVPADSGGVRSWLAAQGGTIRPCRGVSAAGCLPRSPSGLLHTTGCVIYAFMVDN